MSAKHAKNKPYIIGLTGGIATGKSTASAYFQHKGIQIIDSDLIVENLWKENQDMIQKAESLFGFEIKTKRDLTKISKLIYGNKKLRLRLNDLVHPYVYEVIENRLKEISGLVVIDMPLLYEVGYEKHCDVVAVVYVPEAIQIERLMKRDDITKANAQKRLDAQLPIEDKKLKADVVLDNSEDLNFLYFQIDQLLKGITHEE